MLQLLFSVSLLLPVLLFSVPNLFFADSVTAATVAAGAAAAAAASTVAGSCLD